ncbi:MAG: LytTR family DNA-binding domain-containing protein [Lachnospiraceae bacterium]|nr:LytTR family DNA-binding domain-containing protein [Lachnospiraceae bacterium]
MKVAICDDNEGYRNLIRRECEKLNHKDGRCFELLEFASGSELKKHLRNIDILLLDIEMGDENGLQIKDYMEANKLNVIIIFVSGHTDYVFDSFGLHVMGFVDKENLLTQLPKLLCRAIDCLQQEEVFIEGVSCKNIRYVLASGVYVKLVLENERELLHRGSLSGLAELLQDYDFCRIHRSCMVNLNYVDKIEGNGHEKKYVRVGDVRLKISDRYYLPLKQKFLEYCRRKAVY